MRVAVIQDYLRMGGTERQSLFLCRELAHAGHEAHLFLFRPGGALWKEMADSAIAHTVLQTFDTHVCFLAPGLSDAVAKFQPDVILCMGRTANCYAGWLQGRLPETPVVATLRTGKTIFPMHHWSLSHVSAVLVNSNWWRRRMLERGFPPGKVKLVHNPLMLRVRPEDTLRWRLSLRSKTGAGPDTCVFVVIASLRPGKRHMALLAAFRAFAARTTVPWQLWIVGAGSETAKCRRYVEESGLKKHVHFFGEQIHTGPWYAGADVAVSASLEDSLPNFLIEAQAMGLPLVATACRGVEECCIPGRTGIVVPRGDEAAFAEALDESATTTHLREAAATQAPVFVEGRFGAEKQAAQTIDFLRLVAEHRESEEGTRLPETSPRRVGSS
jgi:glycosyltransferase involved in cell wall biosynthesis